MKPTGNPGTTSLPAPQHEWVWKKISSLIQDWDTEGWCTDRASSAFHLIQEIFAGKAGPYQPIDTAYHDLSHTLSVTLCWTLIADGYRNHGPVTIPGRLLQAGFYGALFHDIGYLKPLGDEQGSGAKFTFIHEKRSCEIAESFLTTDPFYFKNVAGLRRIIGSTGPKAIIQAIPFAEQAEKIVAQMLATADFLAQIGDPQYLERLPALYTEFREAEQHQSLAGNKQRYPDFHSLIEQTPSFWKEFVIPRLNNACEGIYCYLNNPFPDGVNPYMQQAKQNIEKIEKEFPTRAKSKNAQA